MFLVLNPLKEKLVLVGSMFWKALTLALSSLFSVLSASGLGDSAL